MAGKQRQETGPDPRIARMVPVAILVLAVLASCLPFLTPGHPFTFDVWPHLARQQIVYESLRDGFSPWYSFMFYSGYPHLRFYSPLFYVLGGLLSFLTRGNILSALRILLVGVQLLSGGAIFMYLKRRSGDVTAAALGTLVYVLIPWRVRHIAVLANYPMALCYLFLPLLFLAFDRLVDRPGRRTGLLVGLVLVLSALSHVVYVAFALLFLVLHQAAGRFAAFRTGRLQLKYLVPAGLAALGLSAFFIIPFLAEYRSHVFPNPVLSMPVPDLLVILGLKSGVSGYTGGYLGLSVIALVAVAVGSLFLRARAAPRAQLPDVIGIGASLVLAFIIPLLGPGLSFLTIGLLPERLLLFFVFFAAGLACSGYAFLRARVPFFRTRPVLLFCILAALLAIDCLPSHLRVRYPDKKNFLAVKPEIYGLIANQKPSKTLDLNIPVDRIDEPIRTQAYPAMGFVFGGLATPLGPQYHQFAPRSMLYAYPWINRIAAGLADTTMRVLDSGSLKALYLLGVSHLVMEPGTVTVEQDGTEYAALLVKEGVAWDTRFVQPQKKPHLVSGATGAGLVLVSTVIRPLPPASRVQSGAYRIAGDWQELLDMLRIDPGRKRVNFIPVAADREYDSLPGQAAVEVRDVAIRNQDVKLKVRTDCDCFLRLALSFYPELRVLVDGRETEFHETRDHFMYLRCPAGTHTIEVTAPLTPIRRVMLVVSILTLAACLVMLLVPERLDTGRQ